MTRRRGPRQDEPAGLDVERLARALIDSGLMRRYSEYADALPTMMSADRDELAAQWALAIAREYAGVPKSRHEMYGHLTPVLDCPLCVPKRTPGGEG